MKTWHSYALCPVIAIVAEFIAIQSTASPPLDGFPLFLAYLEFFGLVLLGPIAFLFLFEPLPSEPIYWIGIGCGGLAIALLLYNRNRHPFLNLLAGTAWSASGAIALFIGILLAI